MTTLAFISNLGGPDCFICFIILYWILAIHAVIQILKGRLEPAMKIVWLLVIWFMPIIGLILYYTIGRNQSKSP